eukprot:6227208-Amphidinium_carterae.3
MEQAMACTKAKNADAEAVVRAKQAVNAGTPVKQDQGPVPTTTPSVPPRPFCKSPCRSDESLLRKQQKSLRGLRKCCTLSKPAFKLSDPGSYSQHVLF